MLQWIQGRTLGHLTVWFGNHGLRVIIVPPWSWPERDQYLNKIRVVFWKRQRGSGCRMGNRIHWGGHCDCHLNVEFQAVKERELPSGSCFLTHPLPFDHSCYMASFHLVSVGDSVQHISNGLGDSSSLLWGAGETSEPFPEKWEGVDLCSHAA